MYILGCFMAWLPRKLASLPIEVAGWFVVPFLWRYRNVDYYNLPAWTRPWASLEDWTGGFRRHKVGQNCIPLDLLLTYRGLWGFWRYHALRNAAAGTKTWKWFTLKMSDNVGYATNAIIAEGGPKAIEHWWLALNGDTSPGSMYYYRAWIGRHKCFKIIRYYKHFHVEFKVGWRISPQDFHITAEQKHKSFRWIYGTTATLSLRIGRV